MLITIFTDGGITGDNKEDQPCYYAYHACCERGGECGARSEVGLGTSNQAEYRGLILALDDLPNIIALIERESLEPLEVEFKSDSKIMVNQVNGVYKTKDPKLVILRAEVISRLACIPKSIPIRFTHVKREFNPITDLLCNLAKKGIIKTYPFTTLTEFKQEHNLEKYKALKDV